MYVQTDRSINPNSNLTFPQNSLSLEACDFREKGGMFYQAVVLCVEREREMDTFYIPYIYR